MPQGFDSATKAAAASSFFRFLMFADIEFDGGTVYVHNGVGEYTFNSNTYLGLGDFAMVEPLRENGVISPNNITISLSAVDDMLKASGIDFYETVDGEDIFNRKVTLYVGAIGSDAALLGTPVERFSGHMEPPAVTVGRENSIAIVVEDEMLMFDRRNGSRYSDAELQNDYPGDLGFEYLTRLEDAKIIWRGRNSSLGGGADRDVKSISVPGVGDLKLGGIGRTIGNG